ncbi:MAG: hypothetical protein JST40_07655 [Armatimonadetes bacterium]|nr:hypothetical protein [Armatimonadota bacterium]
MAKKADEITRALKLKAAPRPNALTFRQGVKKYVLPFEVRALNSDGYLFVHIPPAANILKITDNGLVVVSDDAEAAAAQQSFRTTRKRTGRRTSSKVEMAPELQEALRKIPSGYKLSYTATGEPRLVKTRTRKK